MGFHGICPHDGWGCTTAILTGELTLVVRACGLLFMFVVKGVCFDNKSVDLGAVNSTHFENMKFCHICYFCIA